MGDYDAYFTHHPYQKRAVGFVVLLFSPFIFSLVVVISERKSIARAVSLVARKVFKGT